MNVRTLRENEKNWNNKKTEHELEMKKRGRISANRSRQETMREKVKERNLQQEIQNKMNMLPENQRKKIT